MQWSILKGFIYFYALMSVISIYCLDAMFSTIYIFVFRAFTSVYIKNKFFKINFNFRKFLNEIALYITKKILCDMTFKHKFMHYKDNRITLLLKIKENVKICINLKELLTYLGNMNFPSFRYHLN